MTDKESINLFRTLWSHDPKLMDTKLPLPDSFIHFDKIHDLPKKGIMNGHCFGNSLYLPRHKHGGQRQVFESLKLCVGVVIRKHTLVGYIKYPELVKDVCALTTHAWNLNKKGKVVDWTYGSVNADKYIYLGEIVPSNIAKKFKDAPCVRKHLWSLLGLEPHQFHNTKTKFATCFNEDYVESVG